MFSNLINILGAIRIFTYFTGWIYTWRYYTFFNISIYRIEIPLESFFILPINVIFGNPLKTTIAILVTVVVIYIIKLSIWIINPYNQPFSSRNKFLHKIHRFYLFKKIRSFLTIFKTSLLNEIIIVFWVLTSLFWLARWQGYQDAYLDSFNETTTKPIVTIISPSDKSAIGRNLDDLITKNNSFNLPSFKEYKIIGDVEQFKRILGEEINDKSDNKKPIWQFLTENNDWVYIFPSLPAKLKNNTPPLVLAVSKQEGQTQFLIIH